MAMSFEEDMDISYLKTREYKYEFIKEYVNDKVKTLNNPDIINPLLQPNENIIYKLYSDGTVTREKGGRAYGKRNVTDIMCEIIGQNTFFKFPHKGENEGDTYGFLTYDDCVRVRNIINKLMLQV